MIDEIMGGNLCGKGYLTERYDEQEGDLVHTLTKKGLKEVKEMLKDPEYKKIFVQMVKGELILFPSLEEKMSFLREVCERLNNIDD